MKELTVNKQASVFLQNAFTKREDYNLNPRLTMIRLPKVFQPFLSWVTCKPLSGSVPTKSINPHLEVAKTLGLLALSMAFNFYCFFNHLFWLLPLGWLFTVSALRKIQVVLIHHCSHFNLYQSKKTNMVVGSALSFFFLTEPFKSYCRSHKKDHHSNNHMTIKDPTVIFLLNTMGLKAGESVQKLKRKFIFSLFLPTFHFKFLMQRILQQKESSALYQLLQIFYWLGLIFLTIKAQIMVALFWVFLFPMLILYNISVALRLVVEHTWPQNEFEIDKRHSPAQFTKAIFLGDAYPDYSSGVINYFYWWCKLLAIHLPLRIFVLVGDTPCHDYHHLHPKTRSWMLAPFLRQQEIESRLTSPYTEIWGYAEAFNYSLNSLSNSKVNFFHN